MKFFLGILFVFAVLFNLGTLQDGHNWGDDFAQYIINARNIIEGKPFASGIMLGNNVVYPPGLPLLLAPLLKAFGLNFKVLKSLNIFCWYLSIIFLYFLFLRIEGRRFAMMAAVFLAFSSFFFVYKQNVLSDIPFFLFVCSSLYVFERWKVSDSTQQGTLFFVVFIFLISAALWLRTAGVTLFIAALFYFIFIWRNVRAIIAVTAVFIINEFLLLYWMGGWQPGFFASAAESPYVFLNSILGHFATIFQSLWFFFCPSQTVFSECLFNKIEPLVPPAAIFLYLAMIWYFIRGIQKKDISYLECFSFFYISILIFWSGNADPVPAFTRFVFPLLPFVFIGTLRSLSFMKQFKLDIYGPARVFFLLLLLINMTNVIIRRDFNDDVFDLPVNSELIDWVRHHVKPDEHFMFYKPRALALLTQREGAAPWIFPDQERYFMQRVKNFGISYVISAKDNDVQGLTAQLEGSPRFKLVWENRGYEIFEFIK